MKTFDERNLLPEILPDDPMHQAKRWFDRTNSEKWQPNPNAMTLSTVDKNNAPSSRIVLCKYFVADPGYIVFFTNYNSRKGKEIRDNSEVSLVFHWDNIGRQLRIKGIAVYSPSSESDEYFASRNRGSQISAWGSNQSQPVESRSELIKQMNDKLDEFDSPSTHNEKEIPRPPHWGGIRVWAHEIELWMDGEDRVHDRARWTRKLKINQDNSFSTSKWIGTRLQP
jgi:pyridoxamine 5'-phosphate oxidase